MQSDSDVLYEVVLTLAPEIHDAFLAWLREHIGHMTALDGFLSGAAFINSENPNEVICHYRLADMAAMKAYLDGPAAEMRADGVNRFGDNFSATRRILTRI